MKSIGIKDLFSLSKQYREKGDISNSNIILREILKSSPFNLEALFWLTNQEDLTQDYEILYKLEKCFQEINSLNPNQKSYLYYSLARVRENQFRFQEAFDFYSRANFQRKFSLKLFNTDAKIYVGQAKLHKRLFASIKRYPNHILGSGYGSDLIFIIGLPRCGSTLIEAILSMADNTNCFGEGSFLPKVIDELQIIKFLEKEEFTDIDFKRKISLINHCYKKEIGLTNGKSIDKTLTNFYLAGIISRVWPAAKIVHVERKPLDQILSAWKSRFEKGHSYSLDLNDLVKVFIAYKDLIDFWKSHLGSRMYTCKYEDLVSNASQETKRLASFCEIEWNQSMLSPKNSTLLIKTASYKQVREPIHEKSINQWKVYAAQLKPYISKLAEAGIEI